jgi:tetratricopeptide (TPR) repeat protein
MSFQNYLTDAWAKHPEESENIFNDFENHFKLLTTPEEVTSLAHLITHVSGDHLGKWKGGIELLNKIKKIPIDKDELSLNRYIATLSLASNPDYSLEGFSLSDQVRILGMTASAIGSQNEVARACDIIEKANDIAKVYLSKNDPANRSLAIAGNNLACTLLDKEKLDHNEINLMIQSAFVGRKFWELAGTWKEVERAEYRLAKVFLKANVLDKAFEHSEKCLAIISDNGNDPLEEFFGFEALALIEKARRNELGFSEAIEKMKESFEKISSDDQTWCKKTLEKLAES